jgi:hypothetical protein
VELLIHFSLEHGLFLSLQKQSRVITARVIKLQCPAKDIAKPVENPVTGSGDPDFCDLRVPLALWVAPRKGPLHRVTWHVDRTR